MTDSNTTKNEPNTQSAISQHLTRRPRRLRHSARLRKMLRQIQVTATDLICPLFVTHGNGIKSEIVSMPGQFQLSLDRLGTEIDELVELGIHAVILFGIPEEKDEFGSDAFSNSGIIQLAIAQIKNSHPDLVVIADTCLCEYTSHGHCGVVNENGYVLNDETLTALQHIAVSQANAGADIVAPSGMMDGMVAAIRIALDENGFQQIPIMSYSVKYSSAFYGPFRDAADGAPQFGDRKTHQMDASETRQPIVEARLDVEQGADFLMVKPALAYLDVIRDLNCNLPEMPLVAYNVSGEYSMLKAAAQQGWLDEREVVQETLTGIKRAGADLIITYHAKDFCRWQNQTKK